MARVWASRPEPGLDLLSVPGVKPHLSAGLSLWVAWSVLLFEYLIGQFPWEMAVDTW
jgi:hypothetical protein